ncbi:MAG: sigma-70 family RNA polymerase sigma factor, partial [Candidatus Sulfotelmatobacter sp.]
MPDETRPVKPPVSPSSAGSSGVLPGQEKEQLSRFGGVRTDVSTAAMDPSQLMAAMGPHPTSSFQPVMASESYTDAEIMLRVKTGDESAFDYLVQKYRRPLVSFMYRMARNTAAAEDLAQEVFLRVYRSRQTYEASAKFTTWLYRIATNLAVNHARDTRHERPEVTV